MWSKCDKWAGHGAVVIVLFETLLFVRVDILTHSMAFLRIVPSACFAALVFLALLSSTLSSPVRRLQYTETEDASYRGILSLTAHIMQAWR